MTPKPPGPGGFIFFRFFKIGSCSKNPTKYPFFCLIMLHLNVNHKNHHSEVYHVTKKIIRWVFLSKVCSYRSPWQKLYNIDIHLSVICHIIFRCINCISSKMMTLFIDNDEYDESFHNKLLISTRDQDLSRFLISILVFLYAGDNLDTKSRECSILNVLELGCC